MFTGLGPQTLTPSITLDKNPLSFLVAAPPAGNVLKLFSLKNSSRLSATTPTLSGPVDVPVTAYTFPPQATQPGTTQTVDTSDGRFVNSGTQTGNLLWQVHAIAGGSSNAVVRYYAINTASATIAQTGTVSTTGTSYDFNASIAANSLNDVFMTWTSIDPPHGVNAQVRFSGKQGTEGMGTGASVFDSPVALTGDYDPNFQTQRWGDYSQVSIDPLNPKIAWATNETIRPNGLHWGTRIFKLRLP